ncbi:50S ribosomal protein L29 [Candidatus Woesearchaeota archaeon]|nr:50S ribosomal protein L29 [Candidatus Woesearchaeota archaeon]
MKRKEFAKLKKEELEAKLLDVKKELMKENAQVARGSVPKVSLHALKKNIARLYMLLHRGEKKE